MKMDMNKIVLLMMLYAPMLVGAQTLTFTDHEPLGNMRTQVTEQFFRLVAQENKGRIRIRETTHVGAVVTKDVEPNTIVGGVPAKVIMKIKLSK